MTQEQKELLLKDLCARLPYRVMCQCDKIKAQGVLKEIGINYNMCRLYDSFTDESEDCYIFDCKPYLFPLSSMTSEQKREYVNLLVRTSSIEMIQITGESTYDWLNKNMFDWRGLIPMGLANDATGKNIY